jgi:hypothetical protein
VGLALVLTIVGVALAMRLVVGPPGAPQPLPSEEAGHRAQQQVTQLLLREAGLSTRADPIVVTAQEIAAFLVHHVRPGSVPLSAVTVRVSPEGIGLTGVAPVGRLLAPLVGAELAQRVPPRLFALPLWVDVEGRIRLSPERAELLVERAAVGRQRIPVAWLGAMVGGRWRDGPSWPVPRIVDRIDLEPGRLVIHTRPRTSHAPGVPRS